MSDKWHDGQDADGLVDDLFAQARADQPRPGAALTGRVLADAERERAWLNRPPVMAPARLGWLAALGGLFGGGGALAGLVSAALVGVAIGWTAPGSVQAMVPGLGGNETIASIELIPDFGTLLDDETDG